MSTENLEKLVTEHGFFADLDPEYLAVITGCASNVRFEPGEHIFREGAAADGFYLVRYGKVAVEIFAPGTGPITIQTLEEGDLLGWSWLMPPYRRHHDARALELTRAFAFDGSCLRGKCEEDPRFGYQLMRLFARVIVERLHGAHLQLIDLYGKNRHG